MDHTYVRCLGCGGVRVEERSATFPYAKGQVPCPDCGERKWEVLERDPDDVPARP
ncbi:hypothetical protein [Limnochorda pilosa]|uniref:Small CPxCG-related zinc finger protein n=1 Tax=Limnochorda pilosa TaxID=1555112 RepID=A0A0K2SNZ7_LIMPI|nr:hypothetical protein [Limnochorda pilosa]BAS28840.1 hypothetical protein LIP_3011 [Limnochorda pilosa]